MVRLQNINEAIILWMIFYHLINPSVRNYDDLRGRCWRKSTLSVTVICDVLYWQIINAVTSCLRIIISGNTMYNASKMSFIALIYFITVLQLILYNTYQFIVTLYILNLVIIIYYGLYYNTHYE